VFDPEERLKGYRRYVYEAGAVNHPQKDQGRVIDNDIVEHGKKLKGHKNISSIKGIGDKSASVLLSVIGNVKDFANEDKLAAYLGIVPRVRDSNENMLWRDKEMPRNSLQTLFMWPKRPSASLASRAELIMMPKDCFPKRWYITLITA